MARGVYPLRVDVTETAQRSTPSESSCTTAPDKCWKEIQQDFGGTLSAVASRNPHWKSAFALIWTNAAAVGVLTQVGASLRIKQRHATTLLRFAEHILRCERRRDFEGRLLP